MTWFPLFLIATGVAAIYYGFAMFFSRKFYKEWTSDLTAKEGESGDDSFGKDYWYYRYLNPARSLLLGVMFLSAGLIVSNYPPLSFLGLALVAILPVVAFLSIVLGLIVLLSKRANDKFWKHIWFVQSKEMNRKLLAGYLLAIGFFIVLLIYMFLYMAGAVPQIGV